MRSFYSIGWLLVTACAHPNPRLPVAQGSDFEVYAAVLDSMFAPRAESRYSRIALVESTQVFNRENTRALIQSLVSVQGVDSTAARDLASKSYEPHSLQA
jgi:hypothetical protein